MNRWIPLIAVLALLAVLAVYFGPGIYRGALFKRDCAAMLTEAREGRIAGVVSSVVPSQQQRIGALATEHVPPDYNQSIVSLKLTRWERADSATIYAIVTCRIEREGFSGLYQGNLRWRFEGGRWWWDVEGSYGAQFPVSGDAEWVKLDELIPRAGVL